MIIGSKEDIHVRRTTTNLRDDILKLVSESRNRYHIPIFSGSKAEGLRFESSDNDWMFVETLIRVIPSKSYTTLYDINNVILLTMENEMTKAGFSLLKLKEYGRFWYNKIEASRTEIPLLDGCYVSSKKWREIDVTWGGHRHTVLGHGPCLSFERGGQEYDHAFCLKCDFWPTNALSSIHRLHQSSWPSPDILHTIVTEGVLFVPIGAKQSIFEDEEWRMSFSLAEKRLIHSMNHTQFLCYGLLKLFLKEAIDANENVKGLLCSYFLKTALFWEITASPHHWNPPSLLSCFWKCLCRLLQWVSNSYCPNYFIPENNMFQGKIEGENRDKLLQHLNTLYCEGYMCLLRCPSLNIMTQVPPVLLADVLNGKKVNIKSWCRECVLLTIVKEETNANPGHSVCFLGKTEDMCLHLHLTTDNSLEQFLKRQWLKELLTELCFTEFGQYSNHDRCNKSYYKHHNNRMRILKRCRTGLACYRLHQATECYNVGKYSLTLTLARRAEEAIISQGPMYRIPHDRFSKIGDDFPIETMMRKSFLGLMPHPDIPESYIEIFFRKLSSMPVSCPPDVYALFLQYLYYNKQEQWQKCDECRYKMYQLLQHADQHQHLQIEVCCYTTWQVLGICHQMSGDNQAAFHSYRMAIPHESDSHRDATYVRLGTILAKYFLAQTQR